MANEKGINQWHMYKIAAQNKKIKPSQGYKNESLGDSYTI